MTQGPLLPKVGKSLEGAVELLRWCRQHQQDSGIALKLREMQQALSGLALALDYEMDGQTDKAAIALQGSDWLAQQPGAARSSPQGAPEERPPASEAVVYDRDLLLEAALEASRLLTRVLNTFRDDPEFVTAVNETIRRIYTIDASRAHDG
jgi:hypothetical protein